MMINHDAPETYINHQQAADQMHRVWGATTYKPIEWFWDIL